MLLLKRLCELKHTFVIARETRFFFLLCVQAKKNSIEGKKYRFLHEMSHLKIRFFFKHPHMHSKYIYTREIDFKCMRLLGQGVWVFLSTESCTTQRFLATKWMICSNVENLYTIFPRQNQKHYLYRYLEILPLHELYQLESLKFEAKGKHTRKSLTQIIKHHQYKLV